MVLKVTSLRLITATQAIQCLCVVSSTCCPLVPFQVGNQKKSYVVLWSTFFFRVTWYSSLSRVSHLTRYNATRKDNAHYLAVSTKYGDFTHNTLGDPNCTLKRVRSPCTGRYPMKESLCGFIYITMHKATAQVTQIALPLMTL